MSNIPDPTQPAAPHEPEPELLPVQRSASPTEQGPVPSTEPQSRLPTAADARGLVQNSDLRLVNRIGLVALALMIIFGLMLTWQGLLDFPKMGVEASQRDTASYYLDALDYRERRLTLALILRTFVTGLSFVVGLALCTQGGIFILRQVTAFTDISVKIHPRVGAVGGEAPAASPLFSFASYSPGVVFLLGGVVLMIATQYLAIPISTREAFPSGTVFGSGSEGADRGQWIELP